MDARLLESANVRPVRVSTGALMKGRVLAVHRDGRHRFSKQPQMFRLPLGVEGDAHAGATVKHRSRVAHDPTQPNPGAVTDPRRTPS